GRSTEGVEEMAEALAREAQDSWIRLLYALALIEEGRPEEAAEELHRAAEDRPEDVEAQLLAALAAAGQGWIEEAWNALARAEVNGAADPSMLQEVEEALEADAEAAETLLRGELAPSALRTRLLERS
ncbi:MAG TPA: tetratricopeptide repeat protein, partial [Longimicrobiaceae bacterium]|nr:tetratricopeptide repeat protein [Longimicrobiaceae bacterium]